MHPVDAFLKSKSKCAYRKRGEYTHYFNGIKYFTVIRGYERESRPEEVYGFLDWEPLPDITKEE